MGWVNFVFVSFSPLWLHSILKCTVNLKKKHRVMPHHPFVSSLHVCRHLAVFLVTTRPFWGLTTHTWWVREFIFNNRNCWLYWVRHGIHGPSCFKIRLFFHDMTFTFLWFYIHFQCTECSWVRAGCFMWARSFETYGTIRFISYAGCGKKV